MSQLTTVRLGAEVEAEVVVFGAAESPFAGIVARGTVMDLLLLLPSVVLEASTGRSLVCGGICGGMRFEIGREERRQRLFEEFIPRLAFFFPFSSEIALGLVLIFSFEREEQKEDRFLSLSLSSNRKNKAHAERSAPTPTMSSSQQPPEAPAPAAAAAATSEEHLDLVREAMKAKPLMVAPSSSSSSVRVHKDECVYSFDTPFSPGGLYVNLSTWQVR